MSTDHLSAGPPADLPADLTAALARLETLPGRPLAEHVEAFDEVHRLIEDALAGLGGASAAPSGRSGGPRADR